jgi:5'-methylthioadenosine phosphorylase
MSVEPIVWRGDALDNALITAPKRRDPAILARLDAVAGRVLNG